MTLYTGRVVAAWLGVTERRVRQLRDEGVITEKQPGLYDLQPTVTRYIQYIRKGSKADVNDERALLTRAKRKAAEMENELCRGALHRTEDIEKGILTMCLNIRQNFLSLPSKLAPELAAAESQAEIFDRLKAAVEEVLEALSDYRVSFAKCETGDDEEQI